MRAAALCVFIILKVWSKTSRHTLLTYHCHGVTSHHSPNCHVGAGRSRNSYSLSFISHHLKFLCLPPTTTVGDSSSQLDSRQHRGQLKVHTSANSDSATHFIKRWVLYTTPLLHCHQWNTGTAAVTLVHCCCTIRLIILS